MPELLSSFGLEVSISIVYSIIVESLMALQQFHQPGPAGDFGFLQYVGDVFLHLFGDGRWILAHAFGDLSEWKIFV